VPTLAAFAGRLFGDAGLAGTARQHGFDLGELDIPRRQQDQQVIEEIGRLLDEAFATFRNGSEREFHRFLAELLGALRDAAVEQLAGVGKVGAGGGARVDAAFEIVNGEGFHNADPYHLWPKPESAAIRALTPSGRDLSDPGLELRQNPNTEYIGQPIDYSDGSLMAVQAISIDSLKLPRIDFIKIDV
jgi:hypothetical protein